MTTYTAFAGDQLLAQGDLEDLIVQAKRAVAEDRQHMVRFFNTDSGRSFEIDLTGSEKDVLHRVRAFLPKAPLPASKGPGRPKLGVVNREVSLLPRHWEWLETQQGGASVTLRRLVEQASKAGPDTVWQARDRAYQFMQVMAGDRAGYEEALRALYRGDMDGFAASMKGWPKDVRAHAVELATPRT